MVRNFCIRSGPWHIVHDLWGRVRQMAEVHPPTLQWDGVRKKVKDPKSTVDMTHHPGFKEALPPTSG